MKKVKSILALVLVVALTACLFAGCESEADKIEKLAGTWTMVVDDTTDEALALLESSDFYEEEIALVDLTTLQYAQIVTFNIDKTYSFAFDVDGTKECVRQFLLSAFEDMYEGRASLSSTYEADFESMTEEEFRQFYAALYVVDDFDALIDKLTENAYTYDAMEEPWETGTYSIRGSKILCTITGETEAESLGYKIEDNELTLTYIDGVEVYTKA